MKTWLEDRAQGGGKVILELLSRVLGFFLFVIHQPLTSSALAESET